MFLNRIQSRKAADGSHSRGNHRKGRETAEGAEMKNNSVARATPKSRKVSVAQFGKVSSSMSLPRGESNGTHDQHDGTYVEKYRRKYPDKEMTFTDKDRAAAMAMGTKDIKVSLQVKKKREKKQDEPGEREYQIRFALVGKELRNSNPKRALSFINKALEFRPKSRECFIAKSKCHLMLGQAELALEDAETALKIDSEYVKGVYAKAESLYALGDFEHALVYYHRGYNLRPEMEEFRLGIQKAEEVILNIINYAPDFHSESKNRKDSASSRHSIRMSSPFNENITPTGNLQLDIDFLNKLLIHPEICSLNPLDREAITGHANEVLEFLESRKELWSRHRPRSSYKPKCMSA